MQEPNLSRRLREKMQSIMRGFERGIFTGEETTSALLACIRDEVDGLHPDLDDQSLRRKSEALVLEAAKSVKVTNGFLARACRLSLQGSDAGLDTVIEAAISNVRSMQHLEDPDTFDLLLAWLDGGGAIHEELSRQLTQSEALSGASWLSYLQASNGGDTSTAREIIESDVRAGCPASLLAHLRRTEASDIEVPLAHLDQRRLQHEERWGDLASVAVFLAERGRLESAKAWSDLIPDERILPLMTFADQPHHDVFGVELACAIANDARVLAPLAFIDFLAGDDTGVARRVARFHELDRDVGHLFGAFVGHRALIGWLQSRLMRERDERQELLEAIDPQDAWLGLIEAQIESDLADLAEATGDVATAATRRERATRIIANRPDVELYVAHFPYNNLLRRLPVANG